MNFIVEWSYESVQRLEEGCVQEFFFGYDLSVERI